VTTQAANSTEAVLARHFQAFLARDLEGIMKDYTPNAVVFAPNGPAAGSEAIRAGFAGLFGMFTPEVMANVKVTRQDISGEYAYVLWSALPVVPFGGDTFRVSGGKIVAQSFVGQMGP
jgi:ketosteroid isomerase-like protein